MNSLLLLLLGISGCLEIPNGTAFSSVRDVTGIGVSSRAPARKLIKPNSVQQVLPRNGVDEQESLASTGQEGESFVDSSETDGGRKKTILATILAGISGVVFAAKSGVIAGPLDPVSGIHGAYTDSMILRDVVSTLSATALAFAAVKAVGFGFEKGLYSSKVSRKLQHTLLAPAFMLTYPVFSAAEGARYFAAVVTAVNALRLYLAATSEGDSSLARSISRSGDKSEALGGPFIYVCLLSVFILLFWRSSMTGIVAASTMAAGDGMADLVGRRFGKDNKWWFSEDKSIAGTVAFAISASFVSYGLLVWLQYTGCLGIALGSADLALRIVAISVVCSFVELLPIGDDNFTVPLSAAALAALFLH